MLTEWGVDYLQGHHFGRAEIPASPGDAPILAVAATLARRRSTGSLGFSVLSASRPAAASFRSAGSSSRRDRRSWRARFAGGGLGAAPAAAPRRRARTCRAPGEGGEVFPRQFFERAERGGGERRGAEGAAGVLAQLLLLAGEAVDREFEIARQQRLHAVAVKPDELPQEGDRQQRLALDAFLLENDLRRAPSG